MPLAVLGGLALLGVVGVLQSVATVLAVRGAGRPCRANAGALQGGSIRLLVVVLVGGGALWAVWSGRLPGRARGAALALVVTGDLWSIDRLFFDFRGPPSEVFRDDPVTTRLRAEPKPFRVLDVGVYQGSYLMAHDIQTMLGYHGQEIRFYDELLGREGAVAQRGQPERCSTCWPCAISSCPRRSRCPGSTRCSAR